MKLIYAPTSPFVHKVMVLLHETEQLDDVVIQSVATTPLATADEVKSANPLGKIPALQRDDGPTLYDSRVICTYLDDRAKSGATYERRMRPEEKQWDDWETAQLGKVVGGCAALNARWMSHLKGPFDIGHIAVGCALGYVDFRHPDSNWRQGNEALADWFKGFESRPSMLATQPPAG